MSGASIKISLQDEQVQRELAGIIDRIEHPRAAFADIGEYLQRTTRDRFESETAPDGTAWAALKETTKARKKHPKILTESKRLRSSIIYQATATQVLVGSNLLYAAIHQLGGKTRPHDIKPKRKRALAWPGAEHPVSGTIHHPGSDIPARPYLGLSRDDQDEVLAILGEHLEP